MNTFFGILDVRKEGAIGIFYPNGFYAKAEGPESARQALMQEAHRRGYEVNGIHKVEEAIVERLGEPLSYGKEQP